MHTDLPLPVVPHNEHVRELGDVPDDGSPANVLANREGQLGVRVSKRGGIV
jgi:hypothetical protein